MNVTFWDKIMAKLTQQLNSTQSVVPPKTLKEPPPVKVIAKADSGASRHYFRATDIQALKRVRFDPNGPTVHLPNNETITSTVTGQLPFSDKLSTSARQAHVFNDLHSASLVSLGQLCDDDCTIFLHKDFHYVFKSNKLLVTGTRNKSDGLWDIPLTRNDPKL